MLNDNVVRDVSKKQNEPEWMLDRRMEAFENFKKLAMPSFRYGIGISVDVSKLNLDGINPLEEISEIKANFPKGVEILSFRDAYEKHENFLRENFMTKCVLANEDKFAAFHGAFFNHAVLVRIPENTEVEKPIELNLKFKGRSRIDHLLIVAGKNSKATILDSSLSENIPDTDNVCFRNQVVEIIVGENSRIEYRSVQNFSQEVYNFSRKRACVERNGFMHWVDCCIGGKFTQALTKTYLKGENAGSHSWGVIYGDNKQCFDVNSETVHVASRTTSDMMTRVVLNDSAKAVYRGLVRVNPKAIKCEGYQKEDTILLSEDAEADAVPNLEIENNDVKCSHGATISQIDDTKLFYMMSRGIDEKSAKKQIVEGFFDPILVKIDNEDLKKNVKESISKRIGAIV